MSDSMFNEIQDRILDLVFGPLLTDESRKELAKLQLLLQEEYYRRHPSRGSVGAP